jgi:type III secretion protein V
MDGAMKFVKGDVIASFLITLINIFGGLGIGILQKNMEPMAALKRYGLLTIGDGLVTQIPALVLATAAGIVVTRVASEQVDAPLGSELASQLFGEPRALRTASIFVVLLALVPGLPALPFLVIGTLLFAASRARARQLRRDDHERALEPVTPQSPGGPMRFLPVVVPWGLEVSEDLAHLIEDELRGTEVARMGLLRASAAMRETLFTELGVPLPAGRIRSADELPEGHAVLCIHEVPATVIVVPAGKRGAAAVAHVIGEVLPVLRDRAADFLGIAETQALVERLAQLGPAAVREVVPKPVSLPLLCDILRRLLEEGVSIRDLKSILQVLAHAAKTETDPLTLTELVRAELRRPITHGLTRGKHELPVYLLEPQIEEAIRGAIARTSAGSFLTLAPGASRDIVAALEKAIGNHAAALPPVVLTQPDIRRFVRKLVETELPEVKVVSYAELLPEVALKPLGKAVIGVT